MRKFSRPAILIALFSSVLLAQSVDIPLRNWTVPPYTAATGGLTTMTDVTPPRVFVGVAPCRIADTRSGQGFSGQAGPPALSANVTRNFQITGTVTGVPAQCGIPDGADAVSFQFSVGLPTSSGNFIAWPAGGAQPNTSVLNWDGPIGFLGNATIIPVSAGGALSVRLNAAAGQSAHLILDVNGYFSDTLTDGENYLRVTNNSTQFTAYFDNDSTGCSGPCGVYAETSSGDAVYGAALSVVPGSVGVFGYSTNYNGVWAQSTNQDGLAAFGGRDGGYLQGDRHGLIGASVATTGMTYGVVGTTSSVDFGAAGVLGSDGSGVPLGAIATISAGVRGQSNVAAGVLGLSQSRGAAGVLFDSGGMLVTEGDLGIPGYGVYSFGDYGGTGMKFFVEPHPTDASKVIRYIALEGAEPGTYFRGRAKFERGMARITVPEDFRLVTDEAGLSVQITPIGAMATVAVLRADLNEVVVQSSRNVEFYYMVNGIRRTHKDVTKPIAEGNEYMPRSPAERMPLAYTEAQRRLLIQNGTYNADGTVNMETARRLGWDRVWEKRAGRPTPEQAPQ